MRENDPAAKHRDRLRTALLTMRENVLPFVANIHRDVLGLTVHDEQHLDALWETAEKIAGSDFQLNPIEAFVFGASVLLHDTAMAVAAFPGGVAELRETIVWKDSEIAVKARRLNADDASLSSDEEQQVLFSTLRSLHAEQAEKLISFTFKRPKRDEAIPLLQDVGLHDSLGAAIGRIAHSHHWNTADLSSRLVQAAGSVPSFPSDWTINEIKVACLLRCADAAHIDSRRAPTMLYAISPLEGISQDHWDFQNKLNQVTRHKEKLVFYAGQPFGVDDASSWWLAFDTIRMIDGEVKSCNAVLEEIGEQPFESKGVLGIESPRLLSATVRVVGWTPVDAEVKVSDPVHLARTLGGRNLYGSGPLAPVRELLQNAVDAVRARRTHQDRDGTWGKVRLVLEPSALNKSDVWVHVDDNGIGMSERVLTGPLIDFGKSFWSSALLEEEFPGLRSHRPALVGKFGIGFFSVFLLGDAVRVITRRFDEGESSALVLSFDELSRRPLLRKAATGELPLDYSTRISVKLDGETLSKINQFSRASDYYVRRYPVSFVKAVTNLVVGCDVDIEIINRLTGESVSHPANWHTSPPSDFLGEVCAMHLPEEASRMVASHSDRVRVITDDNGLVVGRAALLLDRTNRPVNNCLISVGGFTGNVLDREAFDYRSSIANYQSIDFSTTSILGILRGETSDASRSRSNIAVSANAIKRWAEEQAELIELDTYTEPQLVPICHRLLELGAEPAKLPFGFLGGRFATVAEFRAVLRDARRAFVPMIHSDYKTNFEFRSIAALNTPFYTSKLIASLTVVELESTHSDLLTEDDRRLAVESGKLQLSDDQVKSIVKTFAMRYLVGLAKEVWSSELDVAIERANLNAQNTNSGLGRSWVLSLAPRTAVP